MPDPLATRSRTLSISESSPDPGGCPEGNRRPAEALTLPGPELRPAPPTPLSHSRPHSPEDSGPPALTWAPHQGISFLPPEKQRSGSLPQLSRGTAPCAGQGGRASKEPSLGGGGSARERKVHTWHPCRALPRP